MIERLTAYGGVEDLSDLCSIHENVASKLS